MHLFYCDLEYLHVTREMWKFAEEIFWKKVECRKGFVESSGITSEIDDYEVMKGDNDVILIKTNTNKRC